MGVLRFFRYIVSNYPECLINLIGSYKDCESAPSKGVITEWLEFDLNAVFHPVAGELHAPKPFVKSLIHPKKPPPPPTELPEKIIWARICERLEQIRAIIQPTRGIYFAIDGVAGCSKMCQQRKRRFKAATERKETPGITTWDSTKISCGTLFMEGLAKYIDGFIQRQLENNPAWKNLEIRFSNHRVFSEGEHKCLQHMRANSGLRYMVVSPDADLIFLTAGLHSSKSWIFRENIFDDVDANFFLLNVDKFRFAILQTINMMNHPENIRCRYIDDFIVYAFLIGNDFLPQIPSLNVSNNAIGNLFQAYQRVINKYGPLAERSNDGIYQLRLESVKAFFTEMAKDESSEMIKNYMRSGARIPDRLLCKHLIFPKDEMDEKVADLKKCNHESKTTLNFSAYHDEYYATKMGGIDPKTVVHEYLRGMVFVMRYYLEGIPSWTYSFPFTYAPLFTDFAEHVESFDFNVQFEPSQPFTQFEQLLAILPSKSSYLLPEPLRWLSTSNDSPIADMYPETFEVDLDGKKQEYEGVILLPHVDADRLRAAFKDVEPYLSDYDKKRNRPGKVFVYESE